MEDDLHKQQIDALPASERLAPPPTNSRIAWINAAISHRWAIASAVQHPRLRVFW